MGYEKCKVYLLINALEIIHGNDRNSRYTRYSVMYFFTYNEMFLALEHEVSVVRLYFNNTALSWCIWLKFRSVDMISTVG